VETSGNGSTRSNTIDAASSSEPRLSEDMTGEAARIAAKRGRDAAQKKQERRERKEREESEKQPTGCKCVVSWKGKYKWKYGSIKKFKKWMFLWMF
jgi:hypothetical protein